MKKMKVVTISVPANSNQSWKISLGSGSSTKKNATLCYAKARRFIAKHISKEKMAVKVNYGHGLHNKSLLSNNESYLNYCLACFLEDYLTINKLTEITKNYEKNYI